jgi:phage terminase large subunit-like protein
MEIWRPRATPDNSTVDFPPLSRCFVPATLDDNPALTERDPGYRARLRANTSKAKRKALEQGDWDAIDAVEDALWEQAWLDSGRIDHPPMSVLRVVAVDPADGDSEGDGYGVAVASLGIDGRLYGEMSLSWRKPVAQMVDSTVELAGQVGADRIVVEKNHGGAWMVETFRSRHPLCPISTVWASENKRTRAEPVSVLFEPVDEEAPRAVLVGHHPDLEEQMTSFTGKPGEASPDELDAMVWAMSELMQHGPKRGPRMRMSRRR